jgi:hypothetical protein
LSESAEHEREREAASSAVDWLLIVAAFETVDHMQQPRSSDRQTQRKLTQKA